MKSIYHLIWILFLAIPKPQAQTFDIRFIIGEEMERPSFYHITSDNTILVANTLVDGTNSFGQLQITRLDFQGNVLNTFQYQDTLIGKAYDVVQTNLGNVFFLVFNKNDITLSESTLELYKLDYELNPIWNKVLVNNTYDPSGSIIPFEDKLMINFKSQEINRLMLDFEGNILWEHDIDITNKETYINRGHKNGDGDVIISGTTNVDGIYNGGVYLVSESGTIEWEKEVVDTFSTQFNGVATTINNEIIIAGEQIDGNGYHYGSLTKLSSNNEIIYHKTIDNLGYLIGKDVIVHNDLVYLLCTTSSGIQDIMLMIFDIDGNEISRHNLGDSRNNSADKIEAINDSTLIIVGRGVNEQPQINADIKFITISNLNTISNTIDIESSPPIIIYPNPVLSGSKINISQQIKYGVLYDALGVQYAYINNTNEINTRYLPQGVYFFHAITQDLKSISIKVIVHE